MMQEWEYLLQQLEKHSVGMLLLSNGYADQHGRFEILFGAGCNTEFTEPEMLDEFKGFALGHVGYHFKNKRYRELTQSELTQDQWPAFYFFEPEYYYRLGRDGKLETNIELEPLGNFPRKEISSTSISWEASDTPKDYLEKIVQIKELIRNGVFYEINYCQEFSAELALNPYRLFWELNRTSPAPFASFYKLGDRFLIGGSPERFLQKSGPTLLSQPIKGTLKRSGTADEAEQMALKESTKDRAENVMIVDLVRNDLSRVSKVGSVRVTELCEIYSYPTVHQMISTIISEINEGVTFAEILESLFPMGSMTGAPKLEVMKYIDQLEQFRREIYSGSIGYWFNGDFDLNVVIRSVTYIKGRLQHAVGGAITYDSVPQEELAECMAKASGIRRLFEA